MSKLQTSGEFHAGIHPGMLKLRLFFWEYPLFKWIHRVCRFVGVLRNLAEMIETYWCTEVYRALKIVEIFFLWHPFAWCETKNFLLANIRAYFLRNQWKDPKCLTHFDSLSSADRYSAVYFDVRDNADAGNSAKQTSIVSSLKARAL